MTRWHGEPFDVGSGRSARNAIIGDVDGIRFLTFDYTFTTADYSGTGVESHTTHPFVVTAVGVPVPFPRCRCSPRQSHHG